MNPAFRRLAALTLTALLACAGSARAETGDRDKPINYSADRGDLNYDTKVGKLDGNVVVTQGTITVRAERVTFRQNPDNSMQVTAYGNPVTFRQKRDGSDEYYEGYAQRIEYDGAQDLLELFDRALLKRGTDEIRSNYISYNSATELFKAEGRPSATPIPGEAGRTDRVRGVFQPKEGTLPGTRGPAKGGDAKPAPLTLKPSGEIAPAAK